jgi:mannose-6-phosphate isomerase
MATATPYPLLLRPILMEKVWGGRSLERLGKTLPPAKAIGESWELADLASTSPSGGGGSGARSVIENGALAGKTLHDALTTWGHDLLGHVPSGRDGGYPLLVKFLDARENLSVQVHPSSAYAASNPEAHLKTECWYILDAEPGSVIYKGIKPGVTPERFAQAIEKGTVVEDLIAVPAVPGECHNLPSGTCHALGAGVMVAEVQTPSDTTFRVYDWGRKGRELHLKQALACIDFANPPPAATRWAPELAKARAVPLAKTEYFSISEVVAEDRVFESCDVVVVLRGAGRITGTGGAEFDQVPIAAGATAAIPHALEGRWAVDPAEGGIRYLAVQLGRGRK